MEKDPFKLRFGARLRATGEEFGADTAIAIGKLVGANRATAETWINGRALPKIQQIAKLCDEWGVTLDWLFLGKPDGLPYGTYIRIKAIMDNEQVPLVSEPKAPAALPSLTADDRPQAAKARASVRKKASGVSSKK